jgi:hypothetical protein
LPEGSVDVVLSSNVFEHIPPEILATIHRESYRILKPDGVAAHRIDPGDHFSICDRSITTANFLRYSRAGWWWFGGSGLAYHNRLRCGQHQALLERAGFSILASRVRVSERSIEALTSGRLSVDAEFAGFTAQELAADFLWIVGRKPSC